MTGVQTCALPIYPHPKLTTPLADLPDLQLCHSFLGRPVGTHRRVGRTTDVIFTNTRNGSEHPGDVVLWKLPARGIRGEDVLFDSSGFLYRSQVTSAPISRSHGPEFCTHQGFGVNVELFYVLVFVYDDQEVLMEGRFSDPDVLDSEFLTHRTIEYAEDPIFLFGR